MFASVNIKLHRNISVASNQNNRAEWIIRRLIYTRKSISVLTIFVFHFLWNLIVDGY